MPCGFAPLSAYPLAAGFLVLFLTVMRDDFTERIKRTLGQHAGHRCSRPDCRASTGGPQSDESGALNVGVAAHITAASPGGPRYDPALSRRARAAASNGIWLCQNCAKLVDNDDVKFSATLLRRWKTEREREAENEIGVTVGRQQHRSGLRVELTVGVFVEAGVTRRRIFVIRVANPNERPVAVWGAGIEATDHAVSAPVTQSFMSQLPQHLTDGTGFVLAPPTDNFESELQRKGIVRPVNIFAYVTDALGNRYVSEPIAFE